MSRFDEIRVEFRRVHEEELNKVSLEIEKVVEKQKKQFQENSCQDFQEFLTQTEESIRCSFQSQMDGIKELQRTQIEAGLRIQQDQVEELKKLQQKQECELNNFLCKSAKQSEEFNAQCMSKLESEFQSGYRSVRETIMESLNDYQKFTQRMITEQFPKYGVETKNTYQRLCKGSQEQLNQFLEQQLKQSEDVQMLPGQTEELVSMQLEQDQPCNQIQEEDQEEEDTQGNEEQDSEEEIVNLTDSGDETFSTHDQPEPAQSNQLNQNSNNNNNSNQSHIQQNLAENSNQALEANETKSDDDEDEEEIVNLCSTEDDDEHNDNGREYLEKNSKIVYQGNMQGADGKFSSISCRLLHIQSNQGGSNSSSAHELPQLNVNYEKIFRNHSKSREVRSIFGYFKHKWMKCWDRNLIIVEKTDQLGSSPRNQSWVYTSLEKENEQILDGELYEVLILVEWDGFMSCLNEIQAGVKEQGCEFPTQILDQDQNGCFKQMLFGFLYHTRFEKPDKKRKREIDVFNTHK